MKDQNIAIAAGLIIVVAALGGLTLQNMQAKLSERKSTIEALESSVGELEAEIQSLTEANEEYSRRCSEYEELIRIYEENFHALEEELINSRANASVLESRLHSIMVLVLTRTKPPPGPSEEARVLHRRDLGIQYHLRLSSLRFIDHGLGSRRGSYLGGRSTLRMDTTTGRSLGGDILQSSR